MKSFTRAFLDFLPTWLMLLAAALGILALTPVVFIGWLVFQLFWLTIFTPVSKKQIISLIEKIRNFILGLFIFFLPLVVAGAIAFFKILKVTTLFVIIWVVIQIIWLIITGLLWLLSKALSDRSSDDCNYDCYCWPIR